MISQLHQYRYTVVFGAGGLAGVLVTLLLVVMLSGPSAGSSEPDAPTFGSGVSTTVFNEARDTDEFGGFTDKFGFGTYYSVGCSGHQTLRVQSGDTLFVLAARRVNRESPRAYAVPSVNDVLKVISAVNQLETPDHIEAGQELKLPVRCIGGVAGP